MELEERLKSLAGFNLTRGKDIAPPKEKDRIEKLLNGLVTQNRFGEFVLVSKKFDPCGLHPSIKLLSFPPIKGEFLSQICLPKNRWLGISNLEPGVSSNRSSQSSSFKSPFDPREAVFIDCETTGLAGGVGTYAFLVGLGFLSGEEFSVEQYFMQDFHQERAVLSAVAERLSGFKFLVSFNGKCYDLPLMENRFLINRLDFDSSKWAHLDLLFPSRRIWKRRIGECSLSNLEHQVLGVHREIDVPSFMVPQIYFDYLRSGKVEPLIPVFHHNVHDILSLFRLSFLIDRALEDFTLAEVKDPEDLHSLGRIHFGLGNYNASERCYRQALSDKLTPGGWLSINTSLAFVYKKVGQIEKAKEIWHRLAERDFPFSVSAHEELAKYYEHKIKDYHQALFFVEKAMSHLNSGFSMSGNPTPFYRSGGQAKLHFWEYRRSRLQRKAQKLKVMPDATS